MSGEESELAAALAFYRRETQAANRAWFQGKIDALYSYTHLNDEKRMKALAPYFGSSSWTGRGHGSSITEPRQLLLRPDEPGYVNLGIDRDGTVPPASPEEQRQYIEYLTHMLREASRGDFEPPTEFIEFLTLTDAASERDFRHGQCPGLVGTSWILHKWDMYDKRPEAMDWYNEGWNVITAWKCASVEEGATLMVYGQVWYDTEEEQQRHEDGKLKWRVYVWDQGMYAGGKWFDSIAEFLRDRCQWFHRLPAGWEHQWMRPVERAPDDKWVV